MCASGSLKCGAPEWVVRAGPQKTSIFSRFVPRLYAHVGARPAASNFNMVSCFRDDPALFSVVTGREVPQIHVWRLKDLRRLDVTHLYREAGQRLPCERILHHGVRL